ncbi:hypothetical protein MTO96_015176 [Rhipicephalus appendiculatus]
MAISKRKQHGASEQDAHASSAQRGGVSGGGRTLAGVKKRLIAASRLPRLPREHYRIIVRPRGGMNVKNVSQIKVAHALMMAAQLSPAEIADDIVCSNPMQNIFVVSTPAEKNARAYARVEEITVGMISYEVSSYLAAPDNTCKGVVRGVDLEFKQEQLSNMIVQPRNPRALEVKRIKNTTTVIVLFDGLKVPNYVMCGQSILRCTLYRRQTDVCYACGRLGHRADVCPAPEDVICRSCGEASPPKDHVCTPECVLCGGPHPTADRLCKQRFQVPYVVRRRRRERQRTKYPAPTGIDQLRSHSTSPSRGRAGQRAPRSSSRGGRSSSRGRSRSKDPSAVRLQTPPARDTRWADCVKGMPPTVMREVPPLPEHGAARIAQLERENASLRSAFERLQAEVAELKLATTSAPSKSPPPSGTADIPIELPSEAPADGRPAKKKALSKPLRDEGLDELKSEFSDFKNGMKEFQAELRNTLKSLSEAFFALSMRVAALESTVGSGSSGSTVTDLSSSSGSSKARAPQKAGKQPPYT